MREPDFTDADNKPGEWVERCGMLREILDGFRDSVHVVDRNLRIAITNRPLSRWLERVGLASSLEGMTLAEAFPFLPESEFEEYQQVLRDDKPMESNLSISVGGETLFTTARKFAVHENGEIACIMTVIHNVTGQIQDEEERTKLEGQLRQAQKMEAIGQLAGGIAHDFNNYLQAILGYSQLAMMGLDEAEKRYRDLEHVQDTAEKAAQLTRQLLAFSRRQVLQPVRTNLNLIISDLIKLMRRVIGEDIELIAQTESHLGSIWADPSMVEQIIMNLCINARDAMPNGGRLTVGTANATLDETSCHTHQWVRPGPYVLLWVEDTGTGMPEDIEKHIFEPFFTTKEAGKGTGLGLATVYGIVKQHEGAILVDSRENEGTKFSVYFPYAGETVLAEASQDGPASPGRGETILLAEDEKMIRNLTARILEENGYRILRAENGEDALRVFEENRGKIDLFFLDVVMPYASGQAVHDAILERQPDARILFSSGYSTESAHVGFVLDRGLQLIKKPYRPQALLRKVREVLDSPL